MNSLDKSIFKYIFSEKPTAYARIKGGEKYPTISGIAEFYQLPKGVVVVIDVENLPKTNTDIFACHIHEGNSCDNNFSESGGHFNPFMQPHPKHAGDMSPLFAFDGSAFSVFYTERFIVDEIINRVIILHDSPDDFTSQPSGNSRDKIACGVIQKIA